MLAKAPVCVIFPMFPTSLRMHNRYKTSGPTSMQTWQADSKQAPGYATTEQHPAKFITISIWPVTAATTEQQPLKFIIFAMLFFWMFFCVCTMILSARVSYCLHITLLQSRLARRHDFAEWWLLLIITHERSQSTPITPFSLARNSLATAPSTDRRKN